MNSTTLFVEILITGLESVIWLGFLLGCLFGTTWLSFIGNAFETAQAFTTTLLLGLVYVVGIIFEEVTDALSEPWSDKLKASLNNGSLSRYNDIQDYVYSHYAVKLDDQLGYMRSRRRILRASAFNILLIAIFAIIFIWLRITDLDMTPKISMSIFIAVVGVLGIWLSLFTYKRITSDYVKSFQGIYKSLMADKKKVSSKKVAKAQNYG
jgi:hypothetical protein